MDFDFLKKDGKQKPSEKKNWWKLFNLHLYSEKFIDSREAIGFFLNELVLKV